jgi:ABC-type phosphate transport system substrate-binding protein
MNHRVGLLARRLPALASWVLVASAAATAYAADCDTLPNPVFAAGSSAIKPFLARVASELNKLDEPITIVYQSQGSCIGVASMTTESDTITGAGIIWDNYGVEVPGGCTLAIAGNKVDIGFSDVYPASCGVESLPDDVDDFSGPIQAMTFVVPVDSSQAVISAEAAYLTFGLGEDGDVAPWTDESLIQVRNADSGTQQMIAAAINVPAAKFQGTSNAKSGDLITSLTTAAANGNSDESIGILATDVADVNRGTLKILAYQHYGQDCGYWPDSTDNSFDKQNVRDGHYPIWGPLHMLARVSGGKVANANAKLVIDYLSLAKEPAEFSMIEAEAKGGVVPDCAMRVTRTEELGPLASYMPAKSCECRFVAEATGNAPDDCETCETDDDCPDSAPACNYGYCEVR